jgi:DNA-binding MarR family transcriptional regulator
MFDPMARYPGYSLRRAANATAAALAARLGDIRLKQVDASVLLQVDANPAITASALGRQLDIQRANMVPLLKRLEESGLIARNPIDGKSQGLVLTAHGRTALKQAHAIIEAFEADLVARIPREHRNHLLPALDALWR